MNVMIGYNPAQYDFAPIEKAIRFFYPIGVSADDPKVYFDHIATQKRGRLIVRKYEEKGPYNQVWLPFISEASTALQLQVQDCTYGEMPGYGGFFQIAEMKDKDFLRQKTVYFFVSALGPFYMIMGLDESTVTANDLTRGRELSFRSYNLATVSAVNEYEPYMNKIIDLIKNRFPNYRQVPFYIWSQVVEGLSVPTSCKYSTAFEALFSHWPSIRYDWENRFGTNTPITGDRYFGREDWRNPAWDGKPAFALVMGHGFDTPAAEQA